MSSKKRRGGYLATAEGVKKLKEAKRIKRCTYEEIAEAARETLDKVKRLFNPQWKDGGYKIGEEAVEAICGVLDLKPEEIVSDWYAVEIIPRKTEVKTIKRDRSYLKALKKIEQAARDGSQTLNLSRIKLTELPAEIGQLINLTHLSLYNNSLSSLPTEIGQLNNLTYLYLYNNSLSSLPTEIGQLTNLRYLYLDKNSLSSLPAEIGQLTNLTYLSLHKNSLSSLPAEIGQLTKLRYLSLHNNSLSSLPTEIGQLTNLVDLYLYNNSLSSLPPEIIRKYSEPATIINYYLSLQNNQKKPLHEAKMLLVGQGNVGKTCLRERLVRNQYDPTRNKTDGIDIESWKIKVDQKELQVNIWDFGGQEIMHSTHQFFLTKRSLYLLVVDTTIGEEENRIEYWLKIIQSFAENSPVILVGNKADQHPLDIDKTGLRNKYPQIKAFISVSCQTGAGISELSTVVKNKISQLEHINDELPLPWFNVKQNLEDLKNNKEMDYISYDKYESICVAEKVNRADNQQILIQFLHDLGIVLNFKDDDRLSDTHVLNPEWVTNGVYKILNDYQLIVEQKGILKRSNLNRILDKQRYPSKKHLFIMDMMRKFDLCFDIETDQQFLIPDILTKEEPYTGEWEKTLAFEYHYPVLPSSIISRFIVRMNHCIHQKTYWRSGVVLVQEGNKALVKADREDKKIIIRIKGKAHTRRNLLTAIRSQFNYIHQAIPGIVPVAKVPLIKHPEIILDYQELLGLESMGEKSIPIGKLKKRLPLKYLLDGVEVVRNPTDRHSEYKDNYNFDNDL